MGKQLANPANSHAALMRGASGLIAMCLGASSGAMAQTTTSPDTAAASEVLSEIVVTGTRVIRDGFQAPTPTSVIGAEAIAAKAPANLADFVNELPSMAANNTPRSNGGFVSSGLVGINALNLRNLGANRTLVLLDGQRVGASTITGLVDINTIPQDLVKRVDVVTGGASAGWGSDAVAGVVNFVLDKEFTGLKAEAQGGVTTHDDDRNFKTSLTAGMKFADNRGHVLLSGEIMHNDGVKGIGDRKWYNGQKLFFNPAYTASNGQPQLLNLPGSGFATAAPGGIITSGPLRGTYFGPNGTPAQFNYGPIVGGNFMQGGDWQYADFATSGDLDPEQSRRGIFSRASFDVTDNFQVFAQASYTRATAEQATLNQFNFGNITIQPDNAFIPASISPAVTAPFNLGTLNGDLGPIPAETERSMTRGVIGANGAFDAFGSNWTWDAYGQRTINRSYIETHISITANYNAAIDAVRDADGLIVCRSTLANPNNGCVPFNIFGTGVNSQSAIDYVLGTAWGRTKLTEDVVAATLRGSPFSTWAGPVSVATGLEHRREEVSGSNDPLSTTRSYFAGNFLASFGSYDVTEGFFETVVPLANDLPVARSLDLNAAVRATDYSTSGYVTTWKLGLTYSPIDDITFRTTRSRDIRAPNLAELFQRSQTSTTSFPDPFRGNVSTTAFQATQGNLGLDPEVADTLGVGVILRPRFIPGFIFSTDFYDIQINEAISTVNAATVVNQCFQGNTAFCSQITRNDANVITSVLVQPTNLAKQIARGLDFEASYGQPLFDGDLNVRLLATRYLKNYSADGITPAIDTVGTNGTNGTLKNSLPKWRYSATVAYDHDPVAVALTARGFSAGVYNTSYIECITACPTSTAAHMTINNNHLPGAIYFDANVTFTASDKVESYLSVDNILNKDPYQMAYGTGVGTAPLSVNPLLWDVLGRTFRLGVRFKM